jgi:gamma-glutamylaminecyclotransferase
MINNLVFVYGSLKQGFQLHGIIERCEFIGQYKTRPDFKLVSLGPFPALLDAKDGIEVTGEVYRVDDDILNYLDVVEGVHRGMYVRKPIDVHDQLGHEITVWAYVAGTAGRHAYREVPTGVWQ